MNNIKSDLIKQPVLNLHNIKCRNCIYSEKVSVNKKKFYHCKKNNGVYPSSSSFIECKNFKELKKGG